MSPLLSLALVSVDVETMGSVPTHAYVSRCRRCGSGSQPVNYMLVLEQEVVTNPSGGLFGVGSIRLNRRGWDEMYANTLPDIHLIARADRTADWTW